MRCFLHRLAACASFFFYVGCDIPVATSPSDSDVDVSLADRDDDARDAPADAHDAGDGEGFDASVDVVAHGDAGLADTATPDAPTLDSQSPADSTSGDASALDAIAFDAPADEPLNDAAIDELASSLLDARAEAEADAESNRCHVTSAGFGMPYRDSCPPTRVCAHATSFELSDEGTCEEAFPGRYNLLTLDGLVPATDPTGAPWDADDLGRNRPDVYAVVETDFDGDGIYEEGVRTTTADNSYAPTLRVDVAYDLSTASDSARIRVAIYDDDSASGIGWRPTLIGRLDFPPLTTTAARGRLVPLCPHPDPARLLDACPTADFRFYAELWRLR